MDFTVTLYAVLMMFAVGAVGFFMKKQISLRITPRKICQKYLSTSVSLACCGIRSINASVTKKTL